MDELIKYGLSLSLSDVGSWASLVGLFVSFFTATTLLKIKKKYLFRSSIDEHIKRLNSIASEISLLLGAYADNQKDIEEFFALANVELRAMQKGSTEELLSEIKSARQLIYKYNSGLFFWVKKDENSARAIKTSLSVVSAELSLHRKSLILGG